MSEPIKVAFIDREGFYIDAMITGLEQQPDIDVVASSTIYEEFLENVDDAEIIILQQESNALTRQLLQQLRDGAPDARLIVTGAPDDRDVIVRYIESGAYGYVCDSEDFDQLLQVIRVVRSGEALARPNVIAPLYSRLAELGKLLEDLFPVNPGDIALTERQQEVMELLVLGRTNQEIADELDISVGTVKNHVHKIFSELGVGSREHAIAIYAQLSEQDGNE